MVYHHMCEWLVGLGESIPSNSKAAAYTFMKSIGLPVVKIRTFGSRYLFNEKAKELEEFINDEGPFLIIASPMDPRLPRRGAFNIVTLEDLYEFMSKLEDRDSYTINLIQQVVGVVDSFVGTVVHSNLETLVEIYFGEGVTDVRSLTSGGADPKRIAYGVFIERVFTKGEPKGFMREMCRVRDMVYGFPGYYEFVYGLCGGAEGIWFTDYQSSPMYLNIFEKEPPRVILHNYD